MTRLKKKRCYHCKKLLAGENFNDSKSSKDGLASTCRACVNRRRRELDKERRQRGHSAHVNLTDAARSGQLDTVKAHAGDNPEQLSHLLWTTIRDFHTVQKRPEHVAQACFLIEKGAMPHWTMICETARGGHQSLIDVLLESGVETNVFTTAAIGDDKGLTQLLMGNRGLAKTHHEGVTPLHYCGMSALGKTDAKRAKSFLSCAEGLMRAGAEVDARADFDGHRELRPLHCVCWTGGNRELARLLLKKNADPTGCLIFALGHFHRHGDGHYDIAELLLEAGIDIHAEGDAVLGRFAAHGDAKAVRWLLDHGADPNMKTEDGRTPLHCAAERNTSTKVVKLLLEFGADPIAKTSDGQTPLDIAVLNDKMRVVEYLGNAGKIM